MRVFKSIITVITLFAVIFTVSKTDVVAAQNNSESIDIHVMVYQDGSAKITERRVEQFSSGTERYSVQENIGKSTIKDFKVTMNGQTFQYVEPWNINTSFENKAYKNGLIKTKDGYELAWGISEYGRNEYVIEYTITDFVKQLKDSQMIFWTFLSGDVLPNRVSLEIETVKPLSKEDESIWGFGFDGEVEFVNGNIVSRSYQPLINNDHVTILVQFRDQIFTTGDKYNRKFKSFQKNAFKGSDYKGPVAQFFATVWNIIKGIFIAAIVLIVFIFRNKFRRPDFVERRKFKRRYREEYYRDYPYEGDYMNAYYITYSMGLADFKTLLTSLLLKWIKDEAIYVETTDRTLFKKAKSRIIFLKDDIEDQSNEGQLFRLIRKAAGKDNFITDRKLSRWANNNHHTLSNWEKNVMKKSKNVLTSENYLIYNKKKFAIFDFSTYELSESGKQVETNVYKYVNYLNDFSLLNEHEAINVLIWDQIMIWAAYLNLTDVVTKQFEKLYPNYFNETVYKQDVLRNTTVLAAVTNKSRNDAARRERARSSGAGGSTSRGGGGGGFGGGGGGVR